MNVRAIPAWPRIAFARSTRSARPSRAARWISATSHGKRLSDRALLIGRELDKGMIASPLAPIDLLCIGNFQQFGEAVVLGEENQILAVPSRRGDNQSIEPQEHRGRPNLLSSPVICFVRRSYADSKDIHIFREQANHFSRDQPDSVEGHRLRWQGRQLAPMVGDLGKRSFASQTRVKDGWRTLCPPPPAADGRGERIEAHARRAKDFPIEALGLQSADAL